MFMEPELFAKATEFRETLAPKGKLTDYDAAYQRLMMEARYWHARAKREDGGMEPKPEAVLALQRKYGV